MFDQLLKSLVQGGLGVRLVYEALVGVDLPAFLFLSQVSMIRHLPSAVLVSRSTSEPV